MESLITHPGALSSRRDFFKRAGLGIGVVAAASTLQACDDNGDDGTVADVTLDFSNDFGVLNYAYALEQLEAAFYAQVVMTPYTGITANETAILQDLAKHEAVHAAFLKAALGTNAIGALTADFSSITFSSRASVLGAAQAFEDLGVSAYNGAGQYLASDTYLLLAGKIVSVEARHASVIANLISPNTIAGAGAIDAQGLDRARTPEEVLQIADQYIVQTIGVTGTLLPPA